jgi:hypothetical protein
MPIVSSMSWAVRNCSRAPRRGDARGAAIPTIDSSCVSRASPALNGSRRRAALSSSRAASPPRPWSKAICPRRCSTSATCRPSSGPASTTASSLRAASSAPASLLARVAASIRSARCPGSGVSSPALQERGRRSKPSAVKRPPGRPLQLRSDVLVCLRRGLGSMPGPAIRIGRRVGDGGQRSVQILSVLDRRGALGRRA